VRNAHEHEDERRRAAALALADQWKARLLARLGASLRSPLDSVVTPLGLMLAETKTIQNRADRQQLESAHSNSLILLKIERSLLLLTDLEGISGEVSVQPTDLASFTSEVAAQFRPAIEKAGLELREEFAPVREPVWLNHEMWEIVVANLLSNALKFTEKGEIGVSVRQSGALAEIVIWDTGEGIPSADIPHVFDRVFRGEIKGARSFAGLGIGLALVRDMLGLHDATIRVDSQLHSGTTFTITVPVHRRQGTGNGLATTPSVLHEWPSAQLYVQEALQWPGFTRP
jgi:signal transduction histidine kinase